MAFPGIPVDHWQDRARHLGARAPYLIAAGLLFGMGALYQREARLVWVLSLVAVVLLLAALWLWIARRQVIAADNRARAAAAALIEADPVPCVVTAPGGRLIFANGAARRGLDADAHGTLAALLRERIANPGPFLFRMELRAAAGGAAFEDMLTREGHLRICVHPAGDAGFLWRLDPAADRPARGRESQSLPMLTLGRNDTVLSMNPAARALIGERIGALDAVCRAPPQSGAVCEVKTASGPVPCVFVERVIAAGRRDIFLLPATRSAPLARDDTTIFDDLPVPLLKLDKGGEILRANPQAEALLGPGFAQTPHLPALLEGLGRPVAEWVADAAAGRGTVKPEFLRVRRDDRESFVQVTLHRARDGDKVILIAVLSDATELKSLEAQFVQSQKMQAIGQLAGGIAHDFNNLLTAISGHCDLLLVNRDPGDPEYSDLMQINQNINRAAALVSQLLAFSRKQTLRPRLLDLRDTLADLTHLLNRLVGERISLTLDHEPGLAAIRGDKRQIEQVIMNLVVNARDAMPEGGDIRIVTRNRVLEEPLLRDRATVAPGRYVSVEVIDTGTGIAADKITKVFEPFFTTKRVGEGTGLGLSTVYGIVKQTGGFIFVDSVVGEGTTFQLLFPAHAQAPEEGREVSGRAPRAPQGGGVVLLVEDEAPVRAFASRALQLRGFTVLEAGSAEEALELLADEACRVDLFVTDVVMPGRDGPSWVREALALRPGARVVFMSGYAEETFGDVQAQIENSVFLPKPFSLNDLVETVQRVLDPDPDRLGGGA